MQKKLIALAVAAAISAPAFADNANVTVYGKVHTSLDANGGNSNNLGKTANGVNLTSNSSRLGFKGSEDLGGDLKAVYQYETEILAQGGTSLLGAERDTYLGLSGGFGTVVAGRLPLANQYVGDANFFGEKVGDAGNFTAGGLGGVGMLAVPSRVNRAIGYVSPSLGGVTVTVGYVPNTIQSLLGTQNAAGKDNSFTLRAAYDNNGIFVAANYLNLGVTGLSAATTPTAGTPGTGTFADTGAKITLLSLAGGYDFGVAKIRAQYVNTSANSGAGYAVATAAGLPAAAALAVSGAKQSVYTVGGQFNIGNGSIKAQFASAGKASLDGNDVADTNATLVAVGYDYNLSKRTNLYVAYAKVTNGAAATFSATNYAHSGVGAPGATAGTADSPNALSVGMIHNF